VRHRYLVAVGSGQVADVRQPPVPVPGGGGGPGGEIGPAAPDPDPGRPPAPAPERRPTFLHLTSVVVLVIALVATGSLSLAALTVHRNNEDRLLEQRANETSVLLTSGIPGILTPLTAAAELAEATEASSDGLGGLLEPIVGTGQRDRFRTVSVWLADGSDPEPAYLVGSKPRLLERSPADRQAFVRRASKGAGLLVHDLLDRNPPGLGYSYATSRPGHRYVVYAETFLPADRTQRPQEGEAFADLDYALYLGKAPDLARVLVASTPDLPLPEPRAVRRIPFGDQTLLLRIHPREDLGGPLLGRLPWIILLSGLALALGFASLTERLIRRRALAEGLAVENARLYADQRTVAETLQQSLLPDVLPQPVDAVVGARYQPGVEGMQIGGDWYDVVELDEDRMLLVVGDVSGRGLSAGAVMASMRYALRAYAAQGDSPSTILAKLGELLSVVRDGHFATVLCLVVDRSTRTMEIANAGHPQPLLIDAGGARFIEVPVGVPVGVASGEAYESITVPVPTEGTLLIFTDGLFERRGEPIDQGMERVRAVAAEVAGDLDHLLTTVLERLTGGVADDDTALLGIRWRS
jgi:hypothetical protein